jgi:hypothetical protein
MCITTLMLIIIGYCNGKRRERISGVFDGILEG